MPHVPAIKEFMSETKIISFDITCYSKIAVQHGTTESYPAVNFPTCVLAMCWPSELNALHKCWKLFSGIIIF